MTKKILEFEDNLPKPVGGAYYKVKYWKENLILYFEIEMGEERNITGRVQRDGCLNLTIESVHWCFPENSLDNLNFIYKHMISMGYKSGDTDEEEWLKI